MKIITIICLAGGLSVTGSFAANPDLQQTTEIIEILKSRFVDKDKLDQRLLNDATAAGILDRLGAGAKLLTAEQAASNAVPEVVSTADPAEPLARVEVIEPDIAYIRLGDVVDSTAMDLDMELRKFAEQKVSGYILDLRFADGTNYAAAAEVASRFLPERQELFSLKQAKGEPEIFRSTAVPRSLAVELADAPLILLINGQTRGSAEVVAAALRARERGIVIGTPSAGSAVAWDDVKLSDGRVLRLATAKIAFPKGNDIFPGGLVPDIIVKIDPKMEREAIFSVQTNMTLTASLQPRVTKKVYTEAELVKAFRGEAIGRPLPTATNELTLAGEPVTGAETEGEINKVRDSVLQRAVDILKGIRVLISWQ